MFARTSLPSGFGLIESSDRKMDVPTLSHGNNIRQMARDVGVENAFAFTGLVPVRIRLQSPEKRCVPTLAIRPEPDQFATLN